MRTLLIHTSASGLIMALMGTSCSGPQPLRVAIDPQDQATYVAALNAASDDARHAYAGWIARERDTSVEAVLAHDAKLSKTRNPFDAHKDMRAVSRGAVIYKIHCARCHGDDARGDGPSALRDQLPTSFKTFGKRLAATLHRGAPRKWFRVISNGKGEVVQYSDGRTKAMPAFANKLTREQIWLVITYLQSLDIHGAQRES